ncbi:MAG: preprotein translocase subunit SecG [Desulfamplus sp.]
MATLVLFIHIISCVLLILIVLLQTGKGADMGASFGSASGGQSLFGGAGPATALSKITTVVAIVFMLTSLTMAYTSGHKASQSIMPAATTATADKSGDIDKTAENTAQESPKPDSADTTSTQSTEQPATDKK